MRSARHCLKGIRIARAEQGFSLIEVLLAMLIIGIGVLGLTAANVASLRVRSQSSLESVATQQASTIVERLRAQPLLARSGAYNRTLLSPAPNPDAADLADRELGAWLAQLQHQLPSGTAAIQVMPDGRVLVTVQWSTPFAAEASEQNASFSFRTRL